MQSLVIIWRRFGPYHLARLRGAMEVLQPLGWRVVGLEVAGSDHYAWEPAEDRRIERVTLFPKQNYESVPTARLRRDVKAALDQVNASAVAINGWAATEALAALGWCRANRRRAILMSESHRPSDARWKEWIKARLVRKFDAAVVGGQWHADYLLSLGLPGERIFLGYDAVDNSHFAKRPEGVDWSEFGQRYHLPERFFFANTRFLPRKNIDGLLAAYAGYLDHARSEAKAAWHLVVSGSGEMERQWKARATDLNLADHVHWTGFVQYGDLPGLYNAATAFVHPAHEEAWGLVVNEAAAAGLPLIVSNRVGASCELLKENANGYLVDPADTNSLRSALVRMASLSDEQRRAFGEASRAIVSRFEPRQFGESLRLAIGPADL